MMTECLIETEQKEKVVCTRFTYSLVEKVALLVSVASYWVAAVD